MTETAFKEKFAELIQDEDFQEKLGGLTDRTAIKNLFLENGLELTDEILDGIMEKIAYYEENGELDPETLELVAGGTLKECVACVVFGACYGAIYGGVAGAKVGAVAGVVTYVVISGIRKQKKKKK